MAAVQLAQACGAEVFATASAGKWAVLELLGVKHVMNSRTLDFAEGVMQLTGGRGVDLVLNSLAEEFIPKSLSVLAAGGRFVEIGKRGIWKKERVAQLRSDVSYFILDLLETSRREPDLIQSMLRELMEGFEDGSLKPLPQRVFPIREAVNAFRHMAQAKHTGKIVLSHQAGPAGAPSECPGHPWGWHLSDHWRPRRPGNAGRPVDGGPGRTARRLMGRRGAADNR